MQSTLQNTAPAAVSRVSYQAVEFHDSRKNANYPDSSRFIHHMSKTRPIPIFLVQDRDIHTMNVGRVCTRFVCEFCATLCSLKHKHSPSSCLCQMFWLLDKLVHKPWGGDITKANFPCSLLPQAVTESSAFSFLQSRRKVQLHQPSQVRGYSC